MGGLFNPDNRLMRALSRLFDLMILNLVTLLLCLPVITAGASVTAMHSVMIQMSEDREGYIIRTFFAKFKENFKQATIVWAVMLLMLILIFVDFRVTGVMEGSGGQAMRVVLIVLSLVFLLIGQYIFPLTARYTNTLTGTLDTAVRVSIGFFPKTVAMVVVNAAVLYLGYRYFFYILPLIILFGLTGPGYLCTQIYMTIFHKIEKNSGMVPDEEDSGFETGDGGEDPVITDREE